MKVASFHSLVFFFILVILIMCLYHTSCFTCLIIIEYCFLGLKGKSCLPYDVGMIFHSDLIDWLILIDMF